MWHFQSYWNDTSVTHGRKSESHAVAAAVNGGCISTGVWTSVQQNLSAEQTSEQWSPALLLESMENQTFYLACVHAVVSNWLGAHRNNKSNLLQCNEILPQFSMIAVAGCRCNLVSARIHISSNCAKGGHFHIWMTVLCARRWSSILFHFVQLWLNSFQFSSSSSSTTFQNSNFFFH